MHTAVAARVRVTHVSPSRILAQYLLDSKCTREWKSGPVWQVVLDRIALWHTE